MQHNANCHLGDNWKDCPACLATDMRADSLTIADKEPTKPVRLYVKAQKPKK